MDPPQTSASASSSASGSTPVTLGVRKRVDSNPTESTDANEDLNPNKRPRTSFYDFHSNPDSVEAILLTCTTPETQPRPSPLGSLSSASTLNFRRESFSLITDTTPRRPDVMDNNGSNTVAIYGTPSRRDRRPARGTPLVNEVTSPEAPSLFALRLAYRRSESVSTSSTVRSLAPIDSPLDLTSPMRTRLSMADIMAMTAPDLTPRYSEFSAKYWLRHTRVTIDYKPPTTPNPISGRLLVRSAENYLYFTRGDRVHYKNLNGTGADEIGQLFKLKANEGHLRVMDANPKSRTNILAVGTSRCQIQLWDMEAKKMTANWSNARDISAMAWTGYTLTVGGTKGSIRHYDIRLPGNKVREQSQKIERHEAQISSLSWNSQGRILASGDASGNVFCWESGASVPMEFGDVVQRRKKIVQAGKITATAWCPWRENTLVTGDSTGAMRLWDVHGRFSASNVLEPGIIYTKSAITGMHFSRRSECHELLTTHGPVAVNPLDRTSESNRPRTANSISVMIFPSSRNVTVSPPSNNQETPIGNSVLDVYGTKLIYETPEDSKINITEIWKRKEIRKHASMTNIGPGSAAYGLIR